MTEYLKTKTFSPKVEKRKHAHLVNHFYEKYKHVCNALSEKKIEEI
jgi:hypothetical protein